MIENEVVGKTVNLIIFIKIGENVEIIVKTIILIGRLVAVINLKDSENEVEALALTIISIVV